MVPRYR